jgi:hypothetical protein
MSQNRLGFTWKYSPSTRRGSARGQCFGAQCPSRHGCPPLPDIFEPWLELKIPNAEGIKEKEEIDQALIVSANDRALELFGFRVQPRTFGELRSGLPPEQTTGDVRWVNELIHVVRRIASRASAL